MTLGKFLEKLNQKAEIWLEDANCYGLEYRGSKKDRPTKFDGYEVIGLFYNVDYEGVIGITVK